MHFSENDSSPEKFFMLAITISSVLKLVRFKRFPKASETGGSPLALTRHANRRRTSGYVGT